MKPLTCFKVYDIRGRLGSDLDCLTSALPGQILGFEQRRISLRGPSVLVHRSHYGAIYGRPLRKVFFNFGSNGIGCVNLSGLLRRFLASGLDGIRLFSCLLR